MYSYAGSAMTVDVSLTAPMAHGKTTCGTLIEYSKSELCFTFNEMSSFQNLKVNYNQLAAFTSPRCNFKRYVQ